MVITAETICILAGMSSLIMGYYPSSLSLFAIVFFIIGMIWLVSPWLRWDWAAPVGLFVFIAAAGLGVLIGLSPILMAFSVLVGLLAWDLADFSRRLRSAAPEDDLRNLEKNHLLRLAGLGGIGMVLNLAAIYVRLRFPFGWMFLLTLASVLGIIQLVKRLRLPG